MYMYHWVRMGGSELGMFNATTTVGPGDLVIFSHVTIPIKRGKLPLIADSIDNNNNEA